MKTQLFLFLSLLLIAVNVQATIINVPADQPTIQAGINAASYQDTVLVQPGTYVENLYIQKEIVIGSLFLTTGDKSYIINTVIDGNQIGSVVKFNWCDEIVLTGFTITNGSAEDGGGIYCDHSNPVLSNLIVRENTAEDGGGLYCIESNPILENIMISGNKASSNGGGIKCNKSNPDLKNVTICANSASDYGGGISFSESSPHFDTNNRCNIYLNKASAGNDLLAEDSPTIRVVVDTFTVMNPTNYHAIPVTDFNFSIRYAKLQQVDSDLFVSPDGNNSNSGLSASEPLQTISHALCISLADSLHPHTIYLADGVYSPSATAETFPLSMVSYVSLAGESQTGVILDAEDQNRVIAFVLVHGTTIENLTVTGGLSLAGGGIVCVVSNPYLVNLSIHNNSVQGGVAIGGGIYCAGSSPRLENVSINNNTAIGEWIAGGGGIVCSESNPSFANVTISGNVSNGSGGGIFFEKSNPIFDSQNRCNIYLNHAGSKGNDLAAEDSPTIKVVVDTFTVLKPTDYHVWPLENFTFDILHAKMEQVSADLYVSPDGDDGNSGLTPSEPLRTISSASSKIFADSLSPRTINLADGIYSSSTNGEQYPINLANYINLSGDSRNGVILDAEGQNSAMLFYHNRGIRIANLTITGGWAAAEVGGGICCFSTQLDLLDVTIRGNTSKEGGGIYCEESTMSLENVIINENISNVGGGIYCEDGSSLSLVNTMITNNKAYDNGGGIYCEESSLSFDDQNRCNIYLNLAFEGNDLCVSDSPIIAVVVDTFTVMEPTDYHAYPLDNYTFDILHAKVEPVDRDLYVSPNGDDNNSGLTPSEPLRTTTFAFMKILADSLHPRTIHLLDGIYSRSMTEELFPLKMLSYVSLAGESTSGVILDAEGQNSVMVCHQVHGATIENLTVTGGSATERSDYEGGGIHCSESRLRIKNVVVSGNKAERYGGGISCTFNSDALLENVVVSENIAQDGGGISCTYNSKADLNNVIVSSNIATGDIGYGGYGGGILYEGSGLSLMNVTLTSNKASRKGGGISAAGCHPIIVNTILWNDLPQEIYFCGYSDTISIAYSTVKGGTDGIVSEYNESTVWLEGIRNLDPLFVDAVNGDYHLSDGSPCIGTGTDSVRINEKWYHAHSTDIEGNPRPNPAGSNPDIGAYESEQGPTKITDTNVTQLPKYFALNGNYPNPFNPATTIRYDLAEDAKVSIVIYNVKGQEVKILINENRNAGNYAVNWNATDNFGVPVTAGIYFYRITAEYKGEIFSATRRMVLLR